MTLIFDTETTGKADFKQPPEASCQPRMVQLAALLLDEELEEVASMNLIIKPDGYVISDEVAKIHGITHAQAEKLGVPEKQALELFKHFSTLSETIVAHNIVFDAIVIGKANHIHGFVYAPPKPFCTMKASTKICKLPGGYGGEYKWPSLQEAHKILFGTNFEGAHDAMADVKACARVYGHLIHGDRPKALPTQTERPIPQEHSVDSEYDDDTPMPFGKYKGTRLGKLPDNYVDWLYDQESLSDRRLSKWLHGNSVID